MPEDGVIDVVIIGGGPAGLSAALLLGRCRRNVVVLDEGRPRNEMATTVNGFLGAIDRSPMELLALGRAQIACHPNVSLHEKRVTDLDRSDGYFKVITQDGGEFQARAFRSREKAAAACRQAEPLCRSIMATIRPSSHSPVIALIRARIVGLLGSSIRQVEPSKRFHRLIPHSDNRVSVSLRDAHWIAVGMGEGIPISLASFLSDS